MLYYRDNNNIERKNNQQMQKTNQILKTLLSLYLIILCTFFYQTNAAERKKTALTNYSPDPNLKAEKPVSDRSKVLLRGVVDMFTYAYKDAGITLFSPKLPSMIKDVVVGSPAYYASVQKNDKLLSASFRENKLCLSISRGNTPYYTEICLKPESPSSRENPTHKLSPDMVAIGFRYFIGTGEVTYVDPNSDLFGKIHTRDTYMYLSGANQTNSNTAGNLVYAVFKQAGALHSYLCRQKPVDSFAPDMAEKYRQDGFGIIHAP